MADFADVLAPRRGRVHDSFFGEAMHRDERVPTGDVCFTVGDWAMIVTAGFVLGVALTLALAGI